MGRREETADSHAQNATTKTKQECKHLTHVLFTFSCDGRLHDYKCLDTVTFNMISLSILCGGGHGGGHGGGGGWRSLLNSVVAVTEAAVWGLQFPWGHPRHRLRPSPQQPTTTTTSQEPHLRLTATPIVAVMVMVGSPRWRCWPCSRCTRS